MGGVTFTFLPLVFGSFLFAPLLVTSLSGDDFDPGADDDVVDDDEFDDDDDDDEYDNDDEDDWYLRALFLR